jgi:hypothetical protein
MQSSDARISSHISERELNRKLDSFLDKLLEAIPSPKLPQPKVMTDAEAVEALSTTATLMFAESKPCWMEDSDGVKARAAAVSDSR